MEGTTRSVSTGQQRWKAYLRRYPKIWVPLAVLLVGCLFSAVDKVRRAYVLADFEQAEVALEVYEQLPAIVEQERNVAEARSQLRAHEDRLRDIADELKRLEGRIERYGRTRSIQRRRGELSVEARELLAARSAARDHLREAHSELLLRARAGIECNDVRYALEQIAVATRLSKAERAYLSSLQTRFEQARSDMLSGELGGDLASR